MPIRTVKTGTLTGNYKPCEWLNRMIYELQGTQRELSQVRAHGKHLGDVSPIEKE